MSDTLAQVNEWLDYLFTFGPGWVYFVIFLACFIENIFPPFPGDSFIVASGGLIALARLDPVAAFVTINAGGILSVMVMYYVGRRYGRGYFLKKDFKYFSAADIISVEGRLARWGGGILVGSRFVVGARSALAVVAGIGRYPALRMFFYSLVSYFAFTGLLLYIGYSLAENLGVIEQFFDRYNQIVWPLLALAVLVWLFRRYQSQKKG